METEPLSDPGVPPRKRRARLAPGVILLLAAGGVTVAAYLALTASTRRTDLAAAARSFAALRACLVGSDVTATTAAARLRSIELGLLARANPAERDTTRTAWIARCARLASVHDQRLLEVDVRVFPRADAARVASLTLSRSLEQRTVPSREAFVAWLGAHAGIQALPPDERVPPPPALAEALDLSHGIFLDAAGRGPPRLDRTPVAARVVRRWRGSAVIIEFPEGNDPAFAYLTSRARGFPTSGLMETNTDFWPVSAPIETAHVVATVLGDNTVAGYVEGVYALVARGPMTPIVRGRVLGAWTQADGSIIALRAREGRIERVDVPIGGTERVTALQNVRVEFHPTIAAGRLVWTAPHVDGTWHLFAQPLTADVPGAAGAGAAPRVEDAGSLGYIGAATVQGCSVAGQIALLATPWAGVADARAATRMARTLSGAWAPIETMPDLPGPGALAEPVGSFGCWSAPGMIARAIRGGHLSLQWWRCAPERCETTRAQMEFSPARDPVVVVFPHGERDLVVIWFDRDDGVLWMRRAPPDQLDAAPRVPLIDTRAPGEGATHVTDVTFGPAVAASDHALIVLRVAARGASYDLPIVIDRAGNAVVPRDQ